ncbi:TonB-dependent receptor [Neokomagataea thailandica]|uniref:TonB-dependent outer membrane receptor n=1 Tax=Neokomagataea tanensis NBRC 106556 TaxID=1223519 RepID=A0ABQ0QIK6_9PROT|nr:MULTISPECIES: TonB-dependent receptor [Neokomagataea]GBR46064.1 TonB-dependent outer membrane receptor [Neokomagataea tanensis NBRC 106556]
MDLQHEDTNGYLTGSGERRSNILFKDVAELAPETTLTVQMTYNREWQNTTQGATLADYQSFGNNYGLCNDPARQCYSGYQPSTYAADFDYIGIKSRLNSWLTFENQLYTNGFEHSYTESTDPSQRSLVANGVTLYNAAGKKIATYANDIPGKYADAAMRAFGDTLRFKAHTAYGDALLGIWADVQKDRRYTYAVNLSKNSAPVIGKTGSAYSYDISDLNTSLQPYFELDLHPWHGATITPGIKYTSFQRDYDAAVNKGTKAPLDAAQSYHSWQPSIAINQRLMKNWSAYAQIARGFRAPPMAVFQAGSLGSIKPETTLNYQVGSVYHGRNWMLSVDGYYIDFDNYIAQAQINVPGQIGTMSTYVNSSGAIYKGLEAEGQYALGWGFSLYGNYSVNDATYKNTRVHVASTPASLASAGLLFEDPRGAYFSLMGKFVGPSWGLDSLAKSSGATVFANQYRISSNATADLAFGWRIHNIGGYLRDVTPSLKISNLFNSHAVSAFAGNQNVGNAPLYWRLAGRSVFFNLTATYP